MAKKTIANTLTKTGEYFFSRMTIVNYVHFGQ